jgi:hypothetical protein
MQSTDAPATRSAHHKCLDKACGTTRVPPCRRCRSCCTQSCIVAEKGSSSHGAHPLTSAQPYLNNAEIHCRVFLDAGGRGHHGHEQPAAQGTGDAASGSPPGAGTVAQCSSRSGRAGGSPLADQTAGEIDATSGCGSSRQSREQRSSMFDSTSFDTCRTGEFNHCHSPSHS